MLYFPKVETIVVAFYRLLLLSVSYIETRGCFKKVVLASNITPLSPFLVPDSRLTSWLSLWAIEALNLLSFTRPLSKEALVVVAALLTLVGDLEVKDGGLGAWRFPPRY